MGKKGKKSRFNQVLDIDISYSSNSIAEGTVAPPELNLTAEKVSELQRIKAQLPSAPQSVRIEEDIARIPDCGPFRLVLVNVSFSATRSDIEDFFLPIQPTQIRIAENDGQFRGFCFVDFATKAELATAMDKNNGYILNRRVTMRIADQQNDGNSRRGCGDREGFGRRNYKSRGYDDAPGAEPAAWVRRPARPTQPASTVEKPAYQPPSFIRSQPPPQQQRDYQQVAQPPAAASAATAPLERPIIRIAPRTKPATAQDNDDAAAARRAAIFGAAKPVDIVAREREIEKKLASASLSGSGTAAATPSAKSPPPAAATQSASNTTPPSNEPKQNAWAKPLVSNKE